MSNGNVTLPPERINNVHKIFMTEKQKQAVMFYVYLQNVKSATGPHVTVTVSLSNNTSMNVLLKRACETNCHQLSTQTYIVHNV